MTDLSKRLSDTSKKMRKLAQAFEPETPVSSSEPQYVPYVIPMQQLFRGATFKVGDEATITGMANFDGIRLTISFDTPDRVRHVLIGKKGVAGKFSSQQSVFPAPQDRGNFMTYDILKEFLPQGWQNADVMLRVRNDASIAYTKELREERKREGREPDELGQREGMEPTL